LVNIEETPKSLAELNARYWESLQQGFDNFDFRPQLAEQVRAVSKAGLLDAYQRLLGASNRALWVTTLDDGDKKATAVGVDHAKLKAASEGYYRYSQ